MNDVGVDLRDIDLRTLSLLRRLFNKREELVQIAAVVAQGMDRDTFLYLQIYGVAVKQLAEFWCHWNFNSV